MQAQLRISAKINPPFSVAVIEDFGIHEQCRRQTHAEKRGCRVLTKCQKNSAPLWLYKLGSGRQEAKVK
jgi:hypothetical protein